MQVIAIPVWPIGDVHHRVADDDVQRRAEQAFFRLTPEDDVAALTDVCAGLVLQAGSLLLAPVLVLLARVTGAQSTRVGT